MTTENFLKLVTERVTREEVFENDTTIFFTYEVDEEYRPLVEAMARAIYQHDKTPDHVFPTGDETIDAPYLCKADDALRVAIPLFREKIASELTKEISERR